MVPAGFNIFPLLRTPVPAGGYEEWRIVMKNGSRATDKVFGIFKVRSGLTTSAHIASYGDLLDESKLASDLLPQFYITLHAECGWEKS